MNSTILGGRSLPNETIGSNKTRIMSEREFMPIFFLSS
jgi:hypothetical protein